MIETFEAFEESNDPHGERDFRAVWQAADGRRLIKRSARLIIGDRRSARLVRTHG